MGYIPQAFVAPQPSFRSGLAETTRSIASNVKPAVERGTLGGIPGGKRETWGREISETGGSGKKYGKKHEKTHFSMAKSRIFWHQSYNSEFFVDDIIIFDGLGPRGV